MSEKHEKEECHGSLLHARAVSLEYYENYKKQNPRRKKKKTGKKCRWNVMTDNFTRNGTQARDKEEAPTLFPVAFVEKQSRSRKTGDRMRFNLRLRKWGHTTFGFTRQFAS